MFPNLIKIKISNTEQEPIPNIAVMIKIFAKHKNDYYIIPNTSNGYGIIEVCQNWIRESIEKDRNLFIMDYASTLDDCYSKIEINIMSNSEIENSIQGRKLFGEEINDDMLRTTNHSYLPAKVLVEMQDKEEQLIEIVLQNSKPD